MSINKLCARYCIDVIRCLLQETAIPPLPAALSLAELYDFAKLHGVEAMIFHGLEQLPIEKSDPVWQHWQNRADMLMTQSIVQLAERDLLFAALPAAGIEILPVKGCWLKEQYPDIDYRQMSDLDMLLKPQDLEKAERIMTGFGYTKEEDGGGNHDGYLKPPYMGVELHHSLLAQDDANFSYYNDIWARVIPAEGLSGVFRLKPEDEYIFYLLHLFKHVTYAGTGIRSFLDGRMYRTIRPDMDQVYLKQEYEKLGITKFVQCVEVITNCWFESGNDVPAEMEAMAESILSAGTYGTESAQLRNAIKKAGGKSRSLLAAKIAYWLSLIFLPLRNMQLLYPVLKKAPVLLPVFWVWRPIDRLLHRPEVVVKTVKNTNKEGKELWSDYNWQEFRSK